MILRRAHALLNIPDVKARLKGKRTGILTGRMTTCKAAKMSELKDVPQWVKKIKTIFLLLDVNNTGYISKDDWVRVADRLGEKNGLAQSDPKGDRFTYSVLCLASLVIIVRIVSHFLDRIHFEFKYSVWFTPLPCVFLRD